MTNVGTEEDIEERDKRAQWVEEQEEFYLNEMLASEAGRAVLWRIMSIAGLNRLSFAGEETHSTAFREGERNVANKVLALVLTANPAAYTLMQNEAVSRDTKFGITWETDQEGEEHGG